MNQGVNLVVVGATSLVGEAIIELLEAREFSYAALHLLDVEANAGSSIQVNDKSHRVVDISEFDFAEAQLALFATAEEGLADYAQAASDQGCVVIDCARQFSDEYDIPMVVADVNPERIGEYANRGIIATPSAMASSILAVLAPIHRQAAIKRVNIATYQAVSAVGKAGVEELAGQTARLLNGQTPETNTFAKQIAFNVLGQIGQLEENGYSEEEMALVTDVQNVLAENGLMVNPSCVQVPVFFGHAATLHIECWDAISAEDIRELLTYCETLQLTDDEGAATPVSEAAKSDGVFVSRIREDISCENAVDLWLVADNVKQAIALNGVKIAEILTRQYL